MECLIIKDAYFKGYNKRNESGNACKFVENFISVLNEISEKEAESFNGYIWYMSLFSSVRKGNFAESSKFLPCVDQYLSEKHGELINSYSLSPSNNPVLMKSIRLQPARLKQNKIIVLCLN